VAEEATAKPKLQLIVGKNGKAVCSLSDFHRAESSSTKAIGLDKSSR
jgi:hypothetical protein